MWYDRFINRTDAYALQKFWGGKLQYSCLYQPATPALFEAHLAGAYTVGVSAVNAEGTSRWCCFDADVEGDHLNRIQGVLEKHGWHCVREGQRPGRQGHLWVFFAEPVDAADLRLFGRMIADRAGVAWSAIEFFPKTDRANWDSENGRFTYCSVVRLPLGVHQKLDANGARGWFAGVPQDIPTQVAWIEKQPLNPVAPILQIAPELRQIAVAKRKTKKSNAAPTSVQEVRQALKYIPNTAETHYDFWIRIGLALKSGGMPIELWEEWSAKSPKYQPYACEQPWSSFPDDASIGLGTIFYLAAQNGFNRQAERFTNLLQRVIV